MEGLNVSIFKYPLGFIRVLQFVFLVIALSAANSWYADLVLDCGGGTDKFAGGKTSTFSMSSNKLKICTNGTASNDVANFWTGSWGGAAGFFYFTSVVTLIFVIIVTFAYVVLWNVYQNDKRIPLADLAVTALLFVFWFFATAIWWAAANGIGDQTSESNVNSIINSDPGKWGKLKEVHANNGMLTISVLSGWVLVFTLALDCWFIWKEVVPRPADDPTQVA